jgi:sorting nexin-25
MIKKISSSEMLSWYLDNLRLSLVPLSPTEVLYNRSPAQKNQTKLHAYRKLHVYMPDLLGSVVGRANAKKGASNIWDVFQNRTLNQEWLYRVSDEIFPLLLTEMEKIT